MTKDSRVELARLQKEIHSYLGLPADNLLFDYSQSANNVRLDLITVNPRHNQSFLFHSVLGLDKLDALSKMADYVKSNHPDEKTYTVQWMAKEDRELQTSYFRAHHIY